MIYAGVSTPKAWHLVSWSIKTLTRSKASHAFISFKLGDVQMVLHSTAHGLQLKTYSKFIKQNNIVRMWKVSKGSKTAINKALEKLDTPYDFTAILGFLLWVLPNKAIGRKVSNIFDTGSAYFCSEFIIEFMQCIDKKYFKKIDASVTTPDDIIDILDDWTVTKEVSIEALNSE